MFIRMHNIGRLSYLGMSLVVSFRRFYGSWIELSFTMRDGSYEVVLYVLLYSFDDNVYIVLLLHLYSNGQKHCGWGWSRKAD